MQLHLIYARAANGVIGLQNKLPWHLPEDLAHFKRTTLGCPIIMGRRTWDSLPVKFRPLPGRDNIVLTRQVGWTSPGALPASSLKAAFDLCTPGVDVWVIGGAEVYAHSLRFAQSVVVTEIAADFEGDAFAPKLGEEWQAVASEAHVSSTGLGFSFVTYKRKPA